MYEYVKERTLNLFGEKTRNFWAIYKQSRSGIIGLGVLVAFLTMAVLAPWIMPYDPYALVSNPLIPPNNTNLLGTDELGRDVFSRLVYGTRVSLTVGFLSAFMSVFIGTFIGLFSGYLGGPVDHLLMRITDLFLMMPGVPFIVVLAAILGPSMWNIILAISALGWTKTARIVRSSTLSLKTREFVEVAKSIGANPIQIIFRHIIPNVLPLISANATLGIASAILSEAGVAFLGLGDPTMISWGTMLHYAHRQGALVVGAWWYIFPPGILIMLIMLAFVFTSRALDQAINPRLRRR